jgi:RNA polymerase sigma-70 factor (ECF subfamily)
MQAYRIPQCDARDWWHDLLVACDLRARGVDVLAIHSAAFPSGTPSHEDDQRLVERTRHGDQSAFRQLFETYSPLVYRIIYRMVGSPDDAADLTQDVFVRAYERLHTLKDGQAFHAWITRLAVNLAHDKARRKQITTFSLDAPPPGCDEGSEWQIAADTPHHDTHILSAELSARVQHALLTLSPDHRAVVVLHHLEGMAVEDIAKTVGVPTGTVKSRLARARAELKRNLEGYFEE